MELNIGLLGLQGAIEEHEAAVVNAGNKLNVSVKLFRVTLPVDLEGIDGIIMPGGESTAMIKQGTRSGLLPVLNELIKTGLPVFGTCAGSILLATKTRRNSNEEIVNGAFPFLDTIIMRNGYGTQKDSFSKKLEVKGFDRSFEGIFIRAPIIESVNSPDIEVLATFNNTPIFVVNKNIMATTFHPELTDDTRIHELFLQKVIKYKNKKI
jgi:pyridoxal 5'-phosphate synthase pdxT subunit